jgi:hypothetical protein
LLVAILVVPFAMNFSAHMIATSMHGSEDADNANTEHEKH